ncbi:MAG: hypothetical protein R2809_07590 [Flavobacteriales bacterium]
MRELTENLHGRKGSETTLRKKWMKQEKIIAKKIKGTDDGSLYTFIMEFKGGTYISQVIADNEEKACNQWAESLNIDEIEGFGIRAKQALFVELKNEEATPIMNNKNIWMMGVDLLGHYSVIHIIKTVEEK